MRYPHKAWLHVILTVMLVFMIGLFAYVYSWINERPEVQPQFGVTYSTVYAIQLGLDPSQTFQEIIDDLGVRLVRLPLYWSEIEHVQGEYNWSLIDDLVSKAEQNNVDLTLVVGMKVPRWPECYIPDWAETEGEDFQHKAVLSFIEEAVNRYKGSPSVIRWQVENEPFFPFGQCPTISIAQFKERVALVRSLDDKPIQVTVSGEVGPWLDSAQSADILGISLYRQTWNDLFGYFVYPLSPEYYLFRASLMRKYVTKVVVSELQAEPWFFEPIESKPITDWYDAYTVEMLEENVQFAQDAGLNEVYLWGVEWWYALKQVGENRLWNFARTIF